MFCDTPAGDNASAVIYSVLQTAKANGLDPYAWLRRVMRDLPAAKTLEEMEVLLPWNIKSQQDAMCAMPIRPDLMGELT